MITFIKNFLNSGSKTLNVNGSVTPQVFTFTSVGEQHLTAISCLLKDEGATSFEKFGALNALANGVLIQVTQSGVTRTITTIKDNADLCMLFSQNQFGNGAVLSILSVVSPEGFGDTNNCFVGVLEFDEYIPLADGDTVTVTIQDNLTTVDVFQMACRTVLD